MFAQAVEQELRLGGWLPGRRVDTVDAWRTELEEDGYPRIHNAALEFWAEFGGVSMPHRGPGITCARGSFEFDPSLTVGEADRFAGWSRRAGRTILPIGELDDGRLFAGIDEHNVIYLVADFLARYGEVPVALEMLVLGMMPEELDI